MQLLFYITLHFLRIVIVILQIGRRKITKKIYESMIMVEMDEIRLGELFTSHIIQV